MKELEEGEIQEIARWSLYAQEWEEAVLERDMQILAERLDGFLFYCHQNGHVPRLPELKQICRLEETNEGQSLGDWREDEDFRIQALFELIGSLPGVRREVDGLPGGQQADVLSAVDPAAVRRRIHDWIMQMDIEMNQQDE